MPRGETPPNRDELTQAMSVALTLTGTTTVTMTEFAVYAHGVEAWVCPRCLTVTDMSQRMPLAPTTCVNPKCKATLQP